METKSFIEFKEPVLKTCRNCDFELTGKYPGCLLFVGMTGVKVIRNALAYENCEHFRPAVGTKQRTYLNPQPIKPQRGKQMDMKIASRFLCYFSGVLTASAAFVLNGNLSLGLLLVLLSLVVFFVGAKID